MATYRQLQAYVLKRHGFMPKTCWIAHVKEMSALPMRRAWNRQSEERQERCPPDRVEAIRDALRHFGIIR
jgi:hypothetical protein